MSNKQPEISVIIPTHNRRVFLHRILDALAQQTFPAEKFEVIVVLDGCTDDSDEMLHGLSTPFSLRVINQKQNGPASARNRGADLACGNLLIFLDDDIEPVPGFVMAHANAHDQPSKVVIGHSPAVNAKNNFISLEIQGWWEAMFRVMRQPGHRFTYADMLSGNFSIARDVFHILGGFNLNFPVHEDYEFGVRLIRAGIIFAFEPKAAGAHHEKHDVSRPLHRKYQEGITDIRLGKMYPELIPNLLITRLDKYSRLPSRILYFLTFRSPKFAEWIASGVLKVLPMVENARMLGAWRKLLDGLLGYWYWKGVIQELPTRKDVKDFLHGNPDEGSVQNSVEIAIDLLKGLEHAEQVLDRTRPNALKIYKGETFIGAMPASGGEERLRGVHLRAILINLYLKWLHEGKAGRNLSRLPATLEELATLIDPPINKRAAND